MGYRTVYDIFAINDSSSLYHSDCAILLSEPEIHFDNCWCRPGAGDPDILSMPANKKHLTTSAWQRFLKVTAALLGGYAVALSFHLMLMHIVSKKQVVATMSFSVYIVWCALMIIAFLAHKGWKVWLWYLAATIVFLMPSVYQFMKQ